MEAMEGHSEDLELRGSLSRRIKALLPHKHLQKAQSTADGLLQRSQSFFEEGTGPDSALTPGLKRKMSRSQSLRNVALNISMRMRKSKKSSSASTAGDAAAAAATLHDGSVSAPPSPAAHAADAFLLGWPTPPSSPPAAHRAAPVRGDQHPPPAAAADAVGPGDPEEWPPLPEKAQVLRPSGSRPNSLFRSSSFSSLLHWGHKSTGGRSRRAALSRGSVSSTSISSLGAPGEQAIFLSGREWGGDGKQATSDVAHVSKEKSDHDGGAPTPLSGGENKNKGAVTVTVVGGAAAPAGIFNKREEAKGSRGPGCGHLGGSCERLVRRSRVRPLLVPPCPRCASTVGRPWSLDVTALVEEDEEQAAAAKDDLEGRSRSLTHIDSLDPSMLVKAAAAVACSSKGGPSDPDDPTMPLLLDNNGGSGVGVLGPSKRLSGSAELPAPNDRLYVPGGGGAWNGGSQDSKMRRQKLTRSQVSSSEYFSVSFECLEDPGPEEFVPATKGTTLAEALSFVCSKRGIDLSTVCIYQESAKKPVSIYSTDASRLGGKHLRIKAKEERSPSRSFKGTSSSQGHSRKTSGSYKGYKAGKFFSASTEEPNFSSSEGASGHLDLKAPQPPPSKAPSRQRWSAIFGNNKDTRMGTLSETLDNYSKNGIPAAYRSDESSSKTSSGEGQSSDETLDDEEDLLFLEDDWREVVGGDALAAHLTERETQHQNAIWELLTTEAAYIRTLKVVTDLFLACLLSLQASTGILTEVDTECLFSNIREIHDANLTFWRRHLLPMVQQARRWREGLAGINPLHPRPLDPKDMKEGFLKFREIFHPYTKYCGDQSRCQHYCREKIQENELFAAYLVWCETRKECNRLRLQDIVVKPMQRLTKYSLLLKAIQKHSEDPADIDSLDTMIKSVDEFVNGVNSTLRQRQEQERLRGVIARIEAYDVVETKDDETEKMVRQYSELDLTRPMPGCRPHQRRHLLMEADVRLRDQSTSKVDAHVFLFTDILLVCKAVGGSRRVKGDPGGQVVGEGAGVDGGAGGLVSGGVTPVGSSSDLRMLKVIRQPFVVDRLEAKVSASGSALSFVYLNELKMATAAFTLSASEPKTTKTLHENLLRARAQYDRAKSKARSEEVEEALSRHQQQQQSQPPLTPTRHHAPKLSALNSPYDSAGSTCCLCFYEDSPHGSAAGGGSFGGGPGGGGGGGGLSGFGDSAFGGLVPSCPRSPRCSSSRGSRLSSLAHSHSGSMEMALEAGLAGGGGVSSGGCSSACQSRGVSVETMTDLRGSSLSSDEGSAGGTTAAHSDSGTSLGSGGGGTAPSPAPSVAPPAILHHYHHHHGGGSRAQTAQQQTSSAQQQNSCLQSGPSPGLHQPVTPLQPPSPRAERRAILSRSPTPNTLSVTAMPYGSSSSPSPSASTSPGGNYGGALGATYLGGQSLPNLSAVASGRALSSSSSQQREQPSSSVAYLLPPSRSPPPPPINQRGISYPPPSPPRSLRRSHAVVHLPGGRGGAHHHPPLTKTRHVGSLLGPPPPQFSTEAPESATVQPPADLEVPVIGGVLPPSNEGSGEDSALLQEREDSGVVCGEGSGSEVMDAWSPWAAGEPPQPAAAEAPSEGASAQMEPSSQVAAEIDGVGGNGRCASPAPNLLDVGDDKSSEIPPEQRDQPATIRGTEGSDGNSTKSSEASCPVHDSCTDSSCC
ncbi:uncharacterized protein LOC124163575 isoform X2 [Ischnura elegans]|uniref:uncharacterized protein LOC124163575 isoform X2 n=1 Tax=Ischnura elegans TaxID=197161 RepID=UPI001ED8A807|nr:uncharacterized protein LOC124163575 isoform X2 [Ischnura elegans]